MDHATDMSSLLGYNYSYRFSLDEQIIPDGVTNIVKEDGDPTTLLFEFKTKFILKLRTTIDIAIPIDIESESSRVLTSGDTDVLKDRMIKRLKEYTIIPDRALDRLAEEALAFGREKARDPKNASLVVIPVLVGVDVCTVQQEGEQLDEVMDRGIRAEWVGQPGSGWVSEDEIDEDLWCFLRNLTRIDVSEGTRLVMEVCSICSKGSNVGDQISLLPLCCHAFHWHCVVKWLVEKNSCPSCHRPVYGFSISDLSDCDSDCDFDSSFSSGSASASNYDGCSSSDSIDDDSPIADFFIPGVDCSSGSDSDSDSDSDSESSDGNCDSDSESDSGTMDDSDFSSSDSYFDLNFGSSDSDSD